MAIVESDWSIDFTTKNITYTGKVTTSGVTAAQLYKYLCSLADEEELTMIKQYTKFYSKYWNKNFLSLLNGKENNL